MLYNVVGIYIYIYVCVHIYLYIYIYNCLFRIRENSIFIYTYPNIYICIHTYVYKSTLHYIIYIHGYMHVCCILSSCNCCFRQGAFMMLSLNVNENQLFTPSQQVPAGSAKKNNKNLDISPIFPKTTVDQ